ncbi:MAG: RdgB/HAM1 family non-canonical purine NTP pyrophosphatase [Rhizobiales bacterium]|nr:RdgB/HAM1 family non-canonical purine NTP pyrophosphatase [Hyphomicrobiales bacterium]
MAPKLLIATSNQGKLREFRTLAPEGVELVSLVDLGLPSPEETGATFIENADLKALAAASASGLLALADDSGLEVDTLKGAPGVHSARFAGEPVSDSRNIDKLLVMLGSKNAADRSARFRCAVSVASPAGILARADGCCEGSIGYEPRGSHGFGYDPIFVLPDGRTMAELPPDEKNLISHRAKAIAAIGPALHAILENLRTSAR